MDTNLVFLPIQDHPIKTLYKLVQCYDWLVSKYGQKIHTKIKIMIKWPRCIVYRPETESVSGYGGRRGRDRMVVGFITTCVLSAYHH